MGLLQNIRSRFRGGGKPAVEDIPCRDIVEIVTRYLEGELDEATRRRFEAHLATCDSCVLYVEQIRETIALARASGEPEELSPQLRADLQRAFDGWVASGS